MSNAGSLAITAVQHETIPTFDSILQNPDFSPESILTCNITSTQNLLANVSRLYFTVRVSLMKLEALYPQQDIRRIGISIL